MVSETPDRGKADMSAARVEAALLARHGMDRLPADLFGVDGYRYGNFADALAQAERSRGRSR